MSSGIQNTEALRRGMDRACDAIRHEMHALVLETGEAFASTLRGTYPRVTGALVRSVRLRRLTGGGVRVSATAPHTHLLEYGTRPRVNYTRKNAARGRMAASPIFVPEAVTERAAFFRRAEAILGQRRELV